MTDDKGSQEKNQQSADQPEKATGAKKKQSRAKESTGATGARSKKEPSRSRKQQSQAKESTGATGARSKKEPSRSRKQPNDADRAQVRASAKYVRCAPRKARLVMAHIRGLGIDEARSILAHNPRAASSHVLKLLESAVANAEANHELFADDLAIDKAYVDEGPTLKRYRPRALGRATRIDKRTSHMTITLSTKE